MFSAIKDNVSDFFLYMGESFSDMKERPWMILKYMIVWPYLVLFFVAVILFSFIRGLFYIASMIFSISSFFGRSVSNSSPKVTYVYRDNDDF